MYACGCVNARAHVCALVCTGVNVYVIACARAPPIHTHMIIVFPHIVSCRDSITHSLTPVTLKGNTMSGAALLALVDDKASTPEQITAALEACVAVDMKVKGKYDGQTALHLLAAKFELPAFVEAFIARGAEVNARDNEKCTPLMLAVLNNHPATVRKLLLNGADATIPSEEDEIPLDVAKEDGNEEIIALLSEPAPVQMEVRMEVLVDTIAQSTDTERV